jgi:ABC-2 type transport system permease protein
VAGWAGLFSVFNLIDIVQAKLLGATSTMDVPTSALAGPAAALLCAAIVAGALAILYTRFRKAGTS